MWMGHICFPKPDALSHVKLSVCSVVYKPWVWGSNFFLPLVTDIGNGFLGCMSYQASTSVYNQQNRRGSAWKWVAEWKHHKMAL